MTVVIAAAYFDLTRRFVQNAGPKSIAALAQDSGVSTERLEAFGQTGSIEPAEDVMKIWGLLFTDFSFLEASVTMDRLGFDALRP